jgi:hypothetical protein
MTTDRTRPLAAPATTMHMSADEERDHRRQ